MTLPWYHWRDDREGRVVRDVSKDGPALTVLMKRLRAEAAEYRAHGRAFLRLSPRCDRCGCMWRGNPAPVLHDALWSRLARKEELLCDGCVRRALGRPYHVRDLRPCQFNLSHWRWILGRFRDNGVRLWWNR